MKKVRKSRNGHSNIREIFAFLRTLYGLLAGLSIFFPTSSALLGALPVSQIAVASQGVVSLPLLTSLATVASLFGLLRSIEWAPSLLRASSQHAGDNRAAASHNAASFFMFGFLAVAFYLGGVMVLVPRGTAQSEPNIVAVLIALAHPVVFYCFTRAFTMQGLIEYARSKDRVTQAPKRHAPRLNVESVEIVSSPNEEKSSLPL